MKYVAFVGVSCVGLLATLSTGASAATLFGPTAYLSSADIPAGLYAGGSPTFLENFEDGTLDGGISASVGSVIGPGGLTDSVDADDGAIDGSGTNGHSFFSGSGSTGITFTLPAGETAAGLVWTDGAGTVTFQAFGPGGLLGTIGPVSNSNFPDASFSGTTPEDRFFGVSDPGGITSLFISNSSGGIEVDHVQYGGLAVTPNATPLPGALPLFATGLGALSLLGWRRRKKKATAAVAA
jgi:hypothetical protein